MFSMEKGMAVDFDHIGKNGVAISSPTGFGQSIEFTNYADEDTKAIYKALRQNINGTFFSLEDEKQMAGRDLDWDRVKIVYGKLADILRPEIRKQTQISANHQDGNVVVPVVDTDVNGTGLEEKMWNWIGRSITRKITQGMSDTAAINASNEAISDRNIEVMMDATGLYNDSNDMLKKGVVVIQSKALEQFRNEHKGLRPWQRLAKAYTGFFDMGGAFFGKDSTPESQIYNTANGKRVDLNAIREAGLERLGMASVYKDMMMTAL